MNSARKFILIRMIINETFKAGDVEAALTPLATELRGEVQNPLKEADRICEALREDAARVCGQMYEVLDQEAAKLIDRI